MAGRTKYKRSKRRRLPDEQPIPGPVVTSVCVVSLTLAGAFVYFTYRDWAEDHHVDVRLDMAVVAFTAIVVSVWIVVLWWLARRR